MTKVYPRAVRVNMAIKTYKRMSDNVIFCLLQKRVLVYPNGEYLERAVYAWGESMAQILDNANVRLNLRKEGRCLFNIEGHLVSQSPLKIEQVPPGNFVNEHHRKQIHIVLRHRTSSEILGLSNNSILEMFFLKK